MARSTLLRGLRRDSVPLGRILAVSAIALATANCSTAPQKFAAGPGNGLDPKYGVKTSPRLYNEGDVIPKGGGRRFSGKPYVVAGRTYVPKDDARGYVREGLASWYGAAFHGRMTANGEVFDRHSIAAAHPTLPLPSYVRVTNTANGYSMVVRVNDRGPYHADRVMDVSEEVARALEFHNKGTARVRVAYLGKASVAGSDDRKLLATLRTDGGPAGVRAPVMVADLGPSEEPERYERPARAPLAFKPAPEREERDDVPAPRPERLTPVRAPIVLASAAVKVPAAVQPTALRGQVFRPVTVAGLDPAPARIPPFSARPQDRATGTLSPGVRPVSTRLAGDASLNSRKFAPTSPAPAPMPASAKVAMARLMGTAGSVGKTSPAVGAKEHGEKAIPNSRRQTARLAEIY